jgi:hypothetical protein
MRKPLPQADSTSMRLSIGDHFPILNGAQTRLGARRLLIFFNFHHAFCIKFIEQIGKLLYKDSEEGRAADLNYPLALHKYVGAAGLTGFRFRLTNDLFTPAHNNSLV